MPLSIQAAQQLATVAQVEHRLHRSCAKLVHHGKNCVIVQNGRIALRKIAVFWGLLSGKLMTSEL